MNRRGRLIYDAQHATNPADKEAAREELRHLDDERRAEREAAESREAEEQRARIYFPPEEPQPEQRPSVGHGRGGDLYERLYTKNRGQGLS